MLNLPAEVTAVVALFAPVFTPSVWAHAQMVVVSAILTPGRRTVTAILSVMGLRQSPHLQNSQRVLNRACWSSRDLSQTLLRVLRAVFVSQGPLLLGLDDTLERRPSKVRGRFSFWGE